MTFAVAVRDLDVSYGPDPALTGVSIDLVPGSITGLLGRNGAGKTTLMRVLAARLRPSRGEALVDGEAPYENARVMSEVCMVSDTGSVEDSSRVAQELELCELLRPRWDAEYATGLLERFALDPRARVGALSRGQRSALAIVIGLASRAPLTMFDEPQLGLDAPSRAMFYDELLADYMARPRTVVLSTHLIDEVAPLLEHVVLLDEGRLLLQAPADDLRGRGAEITGPADAVDRLSASLEVLTLRQLGTTKSVVVFSPLDDDQRRRAAAEGVHIGPLPLQELFISLTAKERAS